MIKPLPIQALRYSSVSATRSRGWCRRCLPRLALRCRRVERRDVGVGTKVAVASVRGVCWVLLPARSCVSFQVSPFFNLRVSAVSTTAGAASLGASVTAGILVSSSPAYATYWSLMVCTHAQLNKTAIKIIPINTLMHLTSAVNTSTGQKLL